MILISTLTLAVLLWIFGFDEIVVHGIDEIFNKEVTTNTYWFIFLLVGSILQIIYTLKWLI